jgi:hypothetical protein
MPVQVSDQTTQVSTEGGSKLPSEELAQRVAERVWQLLEEDLRLERERKGDGYRS